MNLVDPLNPPEGGLNLAGVSTHSFRMGLGGGPALVVINDGPNTPRDNMEKDYELFHEIESGSKKIYLRFYSWNIPCVTYGANQKVADVRKIIENMKGESNNLELVKRPTGGGLVIHNPDCITYSLIISNQVLQKNIGLLDSYYQISGLVSQCLNSMGIDSKLHKSSVKDFRDKRINPVCEDFPAKYEIMLNDKKIVGSAQKKGRKSLLQQTQIFIKLHKHVFQEEFEQSIRDWLS